MAIFGHFIKLPVCQQRLQIVYFGNKEIILRVCPGWEANLGLFGYFHLFYLILPLSNDASPVET
jgi:hypothetical protein